MPFRVSYLFGLTTDPNFPQYALPHSAGWSEGVWQNDNVGLQLKIENLAVARAALLPKNASIIGYRIQNYTISGLKLVPGASNTVNQRWAGDPANPGDIPQMGFRVVLPTTNGLNKAVFTLRGIPKNQTKGGEMSTTGFYDLALKAWKNALVGGAWAMVGRNLAAPSYNIVGIAGPIVTTAVPIAGVVENQTYLQLVRSYDVNGVAVRGTFLCTAKNDVTKQYTLQNLNVTAHASGLIRVATLAIVQIAPIENVSVRVVEKKVGRPFEAYRGRASRRKKAA